jgi:citrate lyase subunit beta/citryl-CoA lyase
VVIRPNPWSSPHGPEDLDAAVPLAPDALLVPKVDREADMVRLDAVLEHLERRAGLAPRQVRVVASLESASGLTCAAAIAAAPRVAGLLAAAARDGDTARSVGFRWSPTGEETLAWRTSAVLAGRAVGGQPFVGLWQEVRDLDGLRAFAAANRAIGFAGQVVIHPSHVEPVNLAYSPTAAEVRYYEGMLEAVRAAEAEGSQAVVYEGEHVDTAHVTTARAVVDQARRLGTPPTA